MGGYNNNSNGRPRTILKGKSNYAVWVPACQMELRTEECFEALSADPLVNPTTIDDATTRQCISEWLATREEVPTGGFTIQKTTANKAKWLAEAKSEYKAYCTLNDKALGVIYNLCDKHTQTIIASETTAKGAWDRLSEAYKQ